ncbi:MAG: family 43 glycosylhydrolase [Christensenellales bacterium]
MLKFSIDNGKGGNFAKDPAVVRFNGKYYLYFSAIKDGKLAVGIAVGDTLDNFVFKDYLVPETPAETKEVGAPAAIVIGGKVHLYYQSYGNWETDAIMHAVSEDGVNFIRDENNPVFAPHGDWTVGRAIDADVEIMNGKLFLYVATRDKTMKIQKIAVAVSDNTENPKFVQAYDGAVMEPELPFEGECIEAPAVINENGRMYMFYAAAYNCSPQTVGVAVSDDGIKFTRLFDKPFLENGKPGEWNCDDTGHPYVFRDDDGQVYLFHQGTCDKGKNWYLSYRKVKFENGIPVLED